MHSLKSKVAVGVSTLLVTVAFPFFGVTGVSVAYDNIQCSTPQPAHGADFSGNGANTSGAYDSIHDGTSADNGAADNLNHNGNAYAVGQPLAGCVGNADNKNPPGQAPNGSDPNAGYECDTNQGIGQTNPAHTGCHRGYNI